MFKQMLDQLMAGAQSATTAITKDGLKNPMVAGAGGVLAGLLLGNKNGLKIGSVAAIGAIAFNAYRNWQTNKTQFADVNVVQQPKQQWDIDFNAQPAANQEDDSRVILTAMIAAAKADGVFDEREQQLIHEQVVKFDDPDLVTWVQQEINKPLDVNEITALATSPEIAAEIYLTSLIVIDEQNESEKMYLDTLAEKLGLDPQLRKEIEQQLADNASKT